MLGAALVSSKLAERRQVTELSDWRACRRTRLHRKATRSHLVMGA